MREVVKVIVYDLQESTRVILRTMTVLASPDCSASPIHYRTVVEEAIRLQAIWASHIRVSRNVYAFIAERDPGLRKFLVENAAEQDRLSKELKLLTPASWPRSTHLGMNSMRSRASVTLPAVLRQVEREELTIVPLLRRWVYGGVPANVDVVVGRGLGFAMQAHASA